MLAQAFARTVPRRPRGEKKPIPSEQRDDRYYERRKRNNLAAKKSRDQRKMREDNVVCHILGRKQSVRMGKTESKIDRETENVFNHIIQRKFPILSNINLKYQDPDSIFKRAGSMCHNHLK